MTIKAQQASRARGHSISVDKDRPEMPDTGVGQRESPDVRLRTAVSITPLALEADSRAFKVAMSLRRFGYRSMVLEGARSAADFAQYGLDVRSLSARTPGSGARHEVIDQVRGGSWGRLGYLLLFGAFWLRFAWRYMLLPFARLPRADLYYVHSYEYLPLCLAMRRGARCVYDAHDFYQGILPKDEQPDFDRRYLMPVLGRLERAVAHRCDAVISVSSGVTTALRDATALKPVVLMNSVDRRANKPAGTDIRTAIGLGRDQRLLVMVGNYKVGIPFDFVTMMLSELPSHIHVAFVGRGYEAAEKHAQPAGIAGRLHLLRARPPFEVTSFIATADVGLLLYNMISLNYRSALPNGFFHVIDAGLPVARFALPEVEAVIGGAEIGPLLDPNDPSRAAQAIAQFLVSAELVEARAAASTLGNSMTWETQEHILRDVVDAAWVEQLTLRQ